MIIGDIQKKSPPTPFPLNEVGITNKKYFFILPNKRKILTLINAKVSLGSNHKGIHMSRNIESIQNAIAELKTKSDVKITELPKLLVKCLLSVHEYSKSAEVDIIADIDYDVRTPATHLKSQEVATLVLNCRGERVKDKLMFTNTVGIKLDGMSACPCGQKLTEQYARDKLRSELNLSFDKIEKIISTIPMATHNQRTTIDARIVTTNDFNPDITEFIDLVSKGFSSSTYGLLKRADESSVILTAHENPYFVEDSIRILLKELLFKYGNSLPKESKFVITQENFESIHKHNAYAHFEASIDELNKLVGSYFFMED